MLAIQCTVERLLAVTIRLLEEVGIASLKMYRLLPASALRWDAAAGDDRREPFCRPRLILVNEPTTALD